MFFLYKLNSAFARGADPTELRRWIFAVRPAGQPGAAVHAVLGSTRWEVLVGVRNLFRDPMDAGSIYDELLVVRPPKRVIGGVLVKF